MTDRTILCCLCKLHSC